MPSRRQSIPSRCPSKVKGYATSDLACYLLSHCPVHDFFSQQSVEKPAVFVLKQIMHDWSDPYALKIFRRLREAADSNTTLMIIDTVMAYSCPPAEVEGGSEKDLPPAPLLPNYGPMNPMPYFTDLSVRTIPLMIDCC